MILLPRRQGGDSVSPWLEDNVARIGERGCHSRKLGRITRKATASPGDDGHIDALRGSTATSDTLWNVMPGDAHLAAGDPPQEPAWPGLPQAVKPALSISLTGESPNRTKITFPFVAGIWYDLEEGALQQWLYNRSTIGTGGGLSFVNNIFAPHYYYRVRAVRVEE